MLAPPLPRRDAEALYADMETPKEIMESLLPRKDSQIMGQEIVSIALGENKVATPCLQNQSAMPGLSSFSHKIRGRDVVVYSDNAGAEWAVRRGSRRVACSACHLAHVSCAMRICSTIRPHMPGASGLETANALRSRGTHRQGTH